MKDKNVAIEKSESQSTSSLEQALLETTNPSSMLIGRIMAEIKEAQSRHTT